MAEQDCATRRAPPSRAVLSAAGWTVGCAAYGARRTFNREPETSGGENIAPDSLDRPVAGCLTAGLDADAPPLPQQAATVDLQRSGGGDARQCAASLCGRTIATFQKATTDPWSESKSQPRDEEDLQKYGHERQSLRGTTADFYARLLAKGMKPDMARLTLARKIAAITLTLWKKGERFDAEHLKSQVA